MAIRYFAEFATNGERLITYVADGMPDTAESIMLNHPKAVEITEDEQALYLNGYIRGLNGKPQLKTIMEGETQIEVVRRDKIAEIRQMAKNKLMETDHDIVEYLELHNLTDEEYANLKQQRQVIRDLRDSLIQIAIDLDDVEAIKNISFK